MDILSAHGRRSFCALTGVYDRLEGQVAALRVEGEFVNVHPAGADQHQVAVEIHVADIIDGQIGTRGSFVLLCPVWERMGDALMSPGQRYLPSPIHFLLTLFFILVTVGPDSIPAGTYAGWVTSSTQATPQESPVNPVSRFWACGRKLVYQVIGFTALMSV